MALGLRQREAFDVLEEAWRSHVSSEAPPLIPGPVSSGPQSPKFPELDCLRGLLSPTTITYAMERAATLGIGGDRVLVTSGAIDEEIYLRALCEHHGFIFESLDHTPRESCVQDDDRLSEAMQLGMLQLLVENDLIVVLAPQHTSVRGVLTLIAGNPALVSSFRFTTRERMQRFVVRHAGATIARRATESLHELHPSMSAAPPRWRYSLGPAGAAGLVALVALIVAPSAVVIAFEAMLAAVFIAWMALRILGAAVLLPRNARPLRVSDSELPVYSVMVALYREAASVKGLVSALRQLDYPVEKLDIKLVVEADDRETRTAIAALALGHPFEVLVVPDIGPRTKPKALNAALPLARGAFTVIFDAEDRPEPDQLRRALAAFHARDGKLACVQAALSIDNTADNWLTGMFTAEYAGQFDVFLPALAALRLPLPLGGSSNHFRTSQLREVGAWDPYNVTEDADLGMRLARFGYRAGVIESTTYEEAPPRLSPWLKQRTRWFKGWMLTWLVHMRTPRQLLRELRLPAFLTFQLMVGGNVLAALVHPIFIGWFAFALLFNRPADSVQLAVTTLFGVAVLFGYLASGLLATVGLLRRGLLSHGWVLALTPVHWLLLSLAAWRAFYQLVREPYRWEKTEHGLASTSRTALAPVAQHPYSEIARA